MHIIHKTEECGLRVVPAFVHVVSSFSVLVGCLLI